MPAWIEAGYAEYANRLPRDCALTLTEISALKRTKQSVTAQVLRQEGERLLAAVPVGARRVVLDERGAPWDTRQLAGQLADWRQQGRNVALIIGGPEGLDRAVKTQADDLWSLSPLTLPHPLVRVIVAEQLYRAWSILHNHPYHRA